jgi:S-DNA-T family DNA segregation ATPase FtsK/SpoIIIE
MAVHDTFDTDESTIPAALRRFLRRRLYELVALLLTGLIIILALSLASWSPADPSFNHATGAKPENWLGSFGAIISDQMIQFLGLGVLAFLFIPLAWAARLFQHERIEELRRALVFWLGGTLAFTCLVATLPVPSSWPLTAGLGGNIGEIITGALLSLLSIGIRGVMADAIVFTLALAACWWTIPRALNFDLNLLIATFASFTAEVSPRATSKAKAKRAPLLERLQALLPTKSEKSAAAQPKMPKSNEAGGDVLSRFAPLSLKRPQATAEIEADDGPGGEGDAFTSGAFDESLCFEDDSDDDAALRKATAKQQPKIKPRPKRKFELPSLDLLTEPKKVGKLPELSKDFLEENARRLESVLEDFGVRGQIINVRPGPVVTLYELEPAPGIKSSRVISLADDIARSMSAVSARVAVVSGRNAIGIELPNSKRETVYLRELLHSENFTKSNSDLTLALGKNIGGEPIFANLARMPHLLIAGTTGSGKSVGINTMILSLLYRLPPEKCKLIMIDPKMLELSVYEGIPHLLAPVVTDPRKAVVALKWAVREMEDRYKKMSKTGVRNVDGYNAKIAQMLEKGQKLSRTVQTGFDADTGQPVFEQEEMDLAPMPYIVVIIDEMADLMMVAGKDIEGAVQRLAQMARAAGIHVVMATQRPSVDVITGTIKANFPTRISFQVTSKIDSRTILGEQGAEQLLGQGDMLYMAGGGRISRLHAPFVSDGEVEDIVNHLKAQGAPEYVEAVTEEEEEGMAGESGTLPGGEGGSGDELYDQAVQVVLRDKKVSTSYVQRRLGVGYNKAATLIERMENEGVISSPNGQGKREILVPGDSARP